MFTVKWTVNMFITVFITMVFIYLIKKVSNKYDIPVIKNIANEV
ncbi:hypothetical protein ACQKEY_24605 [Lysinibacillus fusiformis]